MNLYLVTFDLDNTQFLVESETYIEAIQNAIVANQDSMLGNVSYDSSYGLTMNEIKDRSNYSVEDINMRLLAEICRRNDCLGLSTVASNVIIFNG